MIDVDLTIVADDGDGVGVLEEGLISVVVESNEPDNGLGDGDTAGDVNGQSSDGSAVNVTSEFSPMIVEEEVVGFVGTIQLRAERGGGGGE